MTTVSITIEINAPDPDDPQYEGTMTFEGDANVSDGTPPWKGSSHSCPSDIDWYGEAPAFESWEDIQIFDATTGDFRDPTIRETDLLGKYISGEGEAWFANRIEELVRENDEAEYEAQCEYRQSRRWR